MTNLEDTLNQYLETPEEYDPTLKGIYLERLFEEKLSFPILIELILIGRSNSDSRLIYRVEEELLSNASTFSDYKRLYFGIRQAPSFYDNNFISQVEGRLIDSADSFIKILNIYYPTRMRGTFGFLLKITDKLLEYANTFFELSSVYKAAVLSDDKTLEEKSKELILKTATFSELGKFANLSKRLGKKLYWEITKERIKRIPVIGNIFKGAA
ncbi:hypothetical protein HYX16_03360 [Candidatus Woesearchaeota archaeon]|nr:hypothetical protein [Candidatus Woesearchaeota archaeon]